MDISRGFEDEAAYQAAADEEPAMERPPEIGVDERRMHVRAYNYWVSLLGGRPYPSIQDVDPTNIEDFGPHSVLLDFSRDQEDPDIAFLGRALRAECALDTAIRHISEVPSRSLLSRLTDHYLQIIANRAPIGFEAEFVSQRGHNTLYRGILMPLSSDGSEIDFIYGVINWKEMADSETAAGLAGEVDSAIAAAPPAAAAAADCTVWADGPNADYVETSPDESADKRPSTTTHCTSGPTAASPTGWSPRATAPSRPRPPTSAAAQRSIARSASPMISRSPPRTRRRIMPSCSRMPGSRRRRARR